MKPLPITVVIAAVLCALACVCPSQEPDAGTPAATAKKGWPALDRKARKISFDAKVVDSSYGLEFLLCRAGGKEYESLLATDVIPSRLHASLLMLGLYPGIPGRYTGGRYVPPRGAGLQIDFEWKDKEGRHHKARAVDWLELSGKGGQGAKPRKWVFLGSDLMPDGTYIADHTGGIIAVANLPSSVIDVPFESTRDLQNRQFVVNRKAIPPSGTTVRIIITPEEGAEKAKYARANLDIDRFGRMFVDGAEVTMDGLSKWAAKYTGRHSEGMVVVRSAPMALCCFAPRAKLEMKLGGVYDFEEVTMDAPGELLPMTRSQMEGVMKKWKHRFENAHDLLFDPGDMAAEALERIKAQRDVYRKLDDILVEYEKRLNKKLEEYKASRREEKGSGRKETE